MATPHRPADPTASVVLFKIPSPERAWDRYRTALLTFCTAPTRERGEAVLDLFPSFYIAAVGSTTGLDNELASLRRNMERRLQGQPA